MMQIVRPVIPIVDTRRQQGDLTRNIAIWIPGNESHLVPALNPVRDVISELSIRDGRFVSNAFICHVLTGGWLPINRRCLQNILKDGMEIKP